MKKVSVGVDVLLEALIGTDPSFVEELLEAAREGEHFLIVHDFALYCALRSTKPTDQLDLARFAELLRLSWIEASPWSGAADRLSWEPEPSEVEHWRSSVVGDN